MFLTKIGTIGNITKTRVEFEQVANDLIMISIDNDIDNQTGICSYWRLKGNGGNPPLEIGIDTTFGTIKQIIIFIDTDCIESFEVGEICKAKGNVLVDTGVFVKQNDYVNVEGSYFVTIIGRKLFCGFCEEFNANKIISNGDIEIYLDNNKQIIGFAVDNLSESSLKMIKML